MERQSCATKPKMPDAIKRTKSKLLGHIQSSLKKNKLNKVAKSVKVQTLNILLLVNSIFFKIMTAIDRKMLAKRGKTE